MLGLLLAIDDGLLEIMPGSAPEQPISGHRFTSVDYYDGLGIAGAAEEGVWIHSGNAWAQLWDGDPHSVRVSPERHLFIGTSDGRLLLSLIRGRW